MNSFKKLRAESAFELRKTDPRARAAEAAKWKTIAKTLKHHDKHKIQERDQDNTFTQIVGD